MIDLARLGQLGKELLMENYSSLSVELFNDISSVARNIYASMASQSTPMICLGSLEFALGIKSELVKLMSFG